MVDNIVDPTIRVKVRSILKDNNSATAKPRKEHPHLSQTAHTDRFFFNLLEKMIAAILLVIAMPLGLSIALFIWLSDGKPVFFRQKRMGQHGNVFRIFKFRTMRHDAETLLKSDPLLYQKYIANDYKLPAHEDPRMLPIGRFLRRYSFDEIPQFINVLLGEMHLVGPRPIVTDELERYGEHADVFLSVKPGITGLWQVTGRSEIGYPDRKYLDLLYIQNRSLRLDFTILAKTIWKVIKRDGAY